MPGPAGYGYPAQQPRRPGGATAVIAALLGLVLAGVLAAIPIKLLIDIPSGRSLSEVISEVLIVTALFTGAALLLLIGSLATLFRGLAGAILLLLGAVLALVTALVEGPILGAGIGEYLGLIFELQAAEAWFRLGALVLSPIVVIFAALPPTIRYLRHKPGAQQPQFPQQGGYPQPGGYSPTGPPPGGHPQQGYGPGPQQGGPPQGW